MVAVMWHHVDFSELTGTGIPGDLIPDLSLFLFWEKFVPGGDFLVNGVVLWGSSTQNPWSTWPLVFKPGVLQVKCGNSQLVSWGSCVSGGQTGRQGWVLCSAVVSVHDFFFAPSGLAIASCFLSGMELGPFGVWAVRKNGIFFGS